MSQSAEERAEARAAYGWESVVKDIALTTTLTVGEASIFSEPYMKSSGVHPYDLVEWVFEFYRSKTRHEALASVLRHALAAGWLAGNRSPRPDGPSGATEPTEQSA